MSSPTPTKTQDEVGDEAIFAVDKFGIKLEGHPKFCLIDKMDLFKNKRVVKKLLWNNNPTTKELSQI